MNDIKKEKESEEFESKGLSEELEDLRSKWNKLLVENLDLKEENDNLKKNSSLNKIQPDDENNNEKTCFWFKEIEGLVIKKVNFDHINGFILELEDVLYDEEDVASEKAELTIKCSGNDYNDLTLDISLNKKVSRYLMFGVEQKKND